MRRLLTTVTTLGLLSLAGSALAQPTSIFQWSNCAATPITDLAYTGVVNRAIVGVSGLLVGENYDGNEIDMTIIAEDGSLPTVWRFDADSNGCMASAFSVTTTLSLTGCTKLETGTPLSIVGYVLNFPGDPPGAGHIRGGNTHDPTTAAAATTYLLWRFNFDFSQAVDLGCDDGAGSGGTAEKICLVIRELQVIRNAAFDRVGLPNKAITYNGFTGGATCFATPAQAATWGQIKGQYR